MDYTRTVYFDEVDWYVDEKEWKEALQSFGRRMR